VSFHFTQPFLDPLYGELIKHVESSVGSSYDGVILLLNCLSVN